MERDTACILLVLIIICYLCLPALVGSLCSCGFSPSLWVGFVVKPYALTKPPATPLATWPLQPSLCCQPAWAIWSTLTALLISCWPTSMSWGGRAATTPTAAAGIYVCELFLPSMASFPPCRLHLTASSGTLYDQHGSPQQHWQWRDQRSPSSTHPLTLLLSRHLSLSCSGRVSGNSERSHVNSRLHFLFRASSVSASLLSSLH